MLELRCLLLSPALRSNAGMANRQWDVYLRFAQASAPQLEFWLGLVAGHQSTLATRRRNSETRSGSKKASKRREKFKPTQINRDTGSIFHTAIVALHQRSNCFLYRKESNIVTTIPKGVTSFDTATSPQQKEAAWLSSRDSQSASQPADCGQHLIADCQPPGRAAVRLGRTPRKSTAHWTQRPGSCASRCRQPQQTHGAAICLDPAPRRNTAHSRPEHNFPSETRPTNCILTTCSDLHYVLYRTFETLIYIVYVFYCDCHCVQFQGIPHDFSIGFCCHCQRTDGLIIVTYQLAFVAIA